MDLSMNLCHKYIENVCLLSCSVRSNVWNNRFVDILLIQSAFEQMLRQSEQQFTL